MVEIISFFADRCMEIKIKMKKKYLKKIHKFKAGPSSDETSLLVSSEKNKKKNVEI